MAQLFLKVSFVIILAAIISFQNMFFYCHFFKYLYRKINSISLGFLFKKNCFGIILIFGNSKYRKLCTNTNSIFVLKQYVTDLRIEFSKLNTNVIHKSKLFLTKILLCISFILLIIVLALFINLMFYRNNTIQCTTII